MRTKFNIATSPGFAKSRRDLEQLRFRVEDYDGIGYIKHVVQETRQAFIDSEGQNASRVALRDKTRY